MVTPTRRDGRCIWLRQAIGPGEVDAPVLQGTHKADICIVGGGMAGLWTALEIKARDPACDVAIVEADICGGGASGRNSGMVLSQWAKLAALKAFCGDQEAVFLGHAFAESAKNIDAFCKANGIDAEFRPDGWIWGATCETHIGSWNGILANLESSGLHPFNRLSREEIEALCGTDRFLAGIHDPSATTIHPGKLVRGLRRVALARGVRIFENSRMLKLDRRRPAVVETARGRMEAPICVLTLNAWSASLPELRSSILVIASDDAVTEPVPELLDKMGYRRRPLLGDSQTFVTGFRTTADDRFQPGISGGIIGFGGLGANRFEGRSIREADIRSSVARGFPAFANLPYVDSWCGPIDRTRSGLPLFGPLPGTPNIFYGYGFSGNGVATTPVTARILASLALGTKDEWSSCGLVRPPERWLPKEPIRYIGAHMVRQAIRRKDRLEQESRKPGLVVRALAAMAPGGITTSTVISPRR
ncbi:MAG: FAD-binding oxidoreductase [Verrucomicrobiaceae bacterium]|uniref:NAD(P)/FAD-dependent oxidoreductase n=1 Tax=Aestuariivirga sp. TaxID=2650926 RepID=UPI0030167DB3